MMKIKAPEDVLCSLILLSVLLCHRLQKFHCWWCLQHKYPLDHLQRQLGWNRKWKKKTQIHQKYSFTYILHKNRNGSRFRVAKLREKLKWDDEFYNSSYDAQRNNNNNHQNNKCESEIETERGEKYWRKNDVEIIIFVVFLLLFLCAP